MNWQLIIDKFSRKQLKRLPKNDRERIFAIINDLSANPYAGDIEKMEGEKDIWRRRSGAYRIFYEINISQKIIYVFDIKRRTSKTY